MRKSDVLDLSSEFWAKNAPTPASLASTCTTNYFEKTGKCNTGGDDNASFDWVIALLWAGPQCFSNSWPFENCSLMSSTKGAVISEKYGTNRRIKLRVPNNERKSLIFFGSGNSLIALIRSLPILIPSAEITCPKYFTCFDPGDVDARSPSPRLYRLITHKFKVTRGTSLRSVKTRGADPPRCVLHTTTTPR